jgi:WXG100 family type VII secretion target
VAVSQADLDQMQVTAKKFDDINASLDGMLRSLLSELEGLKSQWTGAGGRSFGQVKQQWAASQQEIHRNLAETADAVRTSGHSYSATDTDVAGRMGPIGNNVGPLPI